MLTQEEVRALSGSDAERGWLEIPGTCPENLRVQICETRKQRLQGKRSKSVAAADTAQRKAKVEKLLQEIAAETDAEELLKLKATAASLLL
jgi:hypothetical protein